MFYHINQINLTCLSKIEFNISNFEYNEFIKNERKTIIVNNFKNIFFNKARFDLILSNSSTLSNFDLKIIDNVKKTEFLFEIKDYVDLLNLEYNFTWINSSTKGYLLKLHFFNEDISNECINKNSILIINNTINADNLDYFKQTTFILYNYIYYADFSNIVDVIKALYFYLYCLNLRIVHNIHILDLLMEDIRKFLDKKLYLYEYQNTNGVNYLFKYEDILNNLMYLYHNFKNIDNSKRKTILDSIIEFVKKES